MPHYPQINTIQKRIYTETGLSVMRQTIKNKVDRVDKEKQSKIWNGAVRDTLVSKGYLDPAVQELSAYSQLILESGVNPNKTCVALVKAPGKRGYGPSEFVLVSPLGGCELYCMSEAEFDDLVDPGSDGVRFPTLHARRAYIPLTVGCQPAPPFEHVNNILQMQPAFHSRCSLH